MHTILYIEDEQIQIELFSAYLDMKQIPHDLVSFSSGSEALEYLFQSAYANNTDLKVPDSVFVDLRLPDMDGMEIISAIKKDRRMRGIPVVVLSGFADAEVTTNCYRSGADLVIRKPLRLDSSESFLDSLVV